MTFISKTGIYPNNQIKAEHITRIIDGISGVTPNTQISVSGSISSSYFVGDGRYLTNITSSISNITGSDTYIPIFQGLNTLITSSMYENNDGIYMATFGNSFSWKKLLPSVGGWYRGQSSIEVTLGNPQSSQQTGFDFKGIGSLGYVSSEHTLMLGIKNISSIDISGSYVTINKILVIPPTSSLPINAPTGSILTSGSGANCKPYFYNGTWNALF